MIIVNFKTYAEAQGKKALKLARRFARFNAVYVAAAHLDVHQVAVHARTFSQHIDIVKDGAHTGHVTATAVKAAGACGTLINHSERPVSFEHIKKSIELCKEHKLISIVCAPTLEVIVEIIKCSSPDYIAYEPPELIGGNISVTSSNPNVVRQAIELVSDRTKMLCGAGVKSSKDVKRALELGCVGVLVASGVVKAVNPEKALSDLVMGLQS